MNAGWMDGFAEAPRPALPASAPKPKAPAEPAAPLRAWTKGQAQAWALVPCCPECGERQIRIRTSTTTVAYHECRGCGHTWKLPRLP